MGAAGLEPAAPTTLNHKPFGDSRNPGGAESGADSPDSPQIDPDLAQVIDAWPNLPEHIKAAIKALIQAQDK